MAVKFTQFLFPNGERRPMEIDLPDDIEDMASTLRENGFLFEIENRDGRIWASILNNRVEEQVVDGYCFNGPEVPEMIKKIIREAYTRYCV